MTNLVADPTPYSGLLEHRRNFTESNAILRSARDRRFDRGSKVYLKRLRGPQSDAAKRKTLRALALELQTFGFYSTKTPLVSLERAILTKLYTHECQEKGVSKTSFKNWRAFCDNHAGPSYLNDVPYRLAVPVRIAPSQRKNKA